ncbi:short-chain dehydrogenase reductase protein [Rutstroemia sp. NJR-2017a BBW]|nr:short-chain dehydrogenase reductase protein [Rutstroemia sp. NJR-2017a BBW]
MNIGKKSVPFKAERDIPPLDRKVILVTGGNIGLGKQCVLEYARHNASVIYLAARNLTKAKTALQEIQALLPKTSQTTIKLLELDLSSLASVKSAAEKLKSETSRLDILMLNAGIMAAPPGLTKDGYELQFGTNYLGHALFAKLLLPTLSSTSEQIPNADVRIIMLSSHGHIYAPKPDGIKFSTLKTLAEELGAYTRYGQSKLAMILWVRKMAQLYPKFTLASIHPGVVKTNLMNNATGSSLAIRMLGKVANKLVTPVDQGVRNQIWASVAAREAVRSGEYYEPVGIEGCGTELASDMELAERLWGWTEEELKGWSA